MPVHEIKNSFGLSSRGMKVSQLVQILKGAGAQCQPFQGRPGDLPTILLLRSGHYVILGKQRRGNHRDVFDPNCGWSKWANARIEELSAGLGISISGLAGHVPSTTTESPLYVLRAVRQAWSTRRGAWFLGLIAFAVLLQAALPLASAYGVDTAFSGQSMDSPTAIVIGFAAVFILSAVLKAISAMHSAVITGHINVHMAGWLFERLRVSGARYTESHDSVEISAKLTAAMVGAQFFSDAIAKVVSIVFFIAIGIAVLFFVSPWLVIPGIVGALAVVMVNTVTRRMAEDRLAVVEVTGMHRKRFISQVLPQVMTCERLGSSKQAFGRLKQLASIYEDARIGVQRLSATRATIESSIMSIEQLVFLVFAAYMTTKNSQSIGFFVAAGLYRDSLKTAITSAAGMWIQYCSMRPQLRHVIDLAAAQPDPLVSDVRRQIERGQVQLDDVSFAYSPHDPLVLGNLSFSALPGQCVVISGMSGSGKTTMAKLIAGLYAPTEGVVLVDDQPASSSMTGVGSVFATDRLIANTIRENVAFFRHVDDDAIYEALEAVELGHFVQTLPMKLLTLVDDEGAGLSAGQRQRLLLARALLAKPNLIILDEATCHLDTKTEGAILRRLKSKAITLVIISHRPELVVFADSTYSLQDGRLVPGNGKIMETLQ